MSSPLGTRAASRRRAPTPLQTRRCPLPCDPPRSRKSRTRPSSRPSLVLPRFRSSFVSSFNCERNHTLSGYHRCRDVPLGLRKKCPLARNEIRIDSRSLRSGTSRQASRFRNLQRSLYHPATKTKENPMPSELNFTPAHELAQRIRSKQLSPVELMQACFDRIDETNEVLNAWTGMRDRDELLTEAREMESRIARGEDPGPLAGLPFGVKELEDLAGFPSTHASVPFRDHYPKGDSTQVQRLKAAGAIAIGKTNSPEFGYTAISKNLLFGVSRNAWSPDLGYANVEPDVRRGCDDGVRAFAEMGYKVDEIGHVFDDLGVLWGRISSTGTYAQIYDKLAEDRERFGHAFLTGALTAKKVTWDKYGQAQRARARLVNQLAEFFQKYDLLLTPTLPFDAIDARGNWPTEIDGKPLKRPLPVVPSTPPFNLSGHPAISVRSGFSDRDLPIGLQIVAGRHRDDLVLQAAYAFEQARPWNDRWPVEVAAMAV